MRTFSLLAFLAFLCAQSCRLCSRPSTPFLRLKHENSNRVCLLAALDLTYSIIDSKCIDQTKENEWQLMNAANKQDKISFTTLYVPNTTLSLVKLTTPLQCPFESVCFDEKIKVVADQNADFYYVQDQKVRSLKIRILPPHICLSFVKSEYCFKHDEPNCSSGTILQNGTLLGLATEQKSCTTIMAFEPQISVLRFFRNVTNVKPTHAHLPKSSKLLKQALNTAHVQNSPPQSPPTTGAQLAQCDPDEVACGTEECCAPDQRCVLYKTFLGCGDVGQVFNEVGELCDSTALVCGETCCDEGEDCMGNGVCEKKSDHAPNTVPRLGPGGALFPVLFPPNTGGSPANNPANPNAANNPANPNPGLPAHNFRPEPMIQSCNLGESLCGGQCCKYGDSCLPAINGNLPRCSSKGGSSKPFTNGNSGQAGAPGSQNQICDSLEGRACLNYCAECASCFSLLLTTNEPANTFLNTMECKDCQVCEPCLDYVSCYLNPMKLKSTKNVFPQVQKTNYQPNGYPNQGYNQNNAYNQNPGMASYGQQGAMPYNNGAGYPNQGYNQNGVYNQNAGMTGYGQHGAMPYNNGAGYPNQGYNQNGAYNQNAGMTGYGQRGIAGVQGIYNQNGYIGYNNGGPYMQNGAHHSNRVQNIQDAFGIPHYSLVSSNAICSEANVLDLAEQATTELQCLKIIQAHPMECGYLFHVGAEGCACVKTNMDCGKTEEAKGMNIYILELKTFVSKANPLQKTLAPPKDAFQLAAWGISGVILFLALFFMFLIIKARRGRGQVKRRRNRTIIGKLDRWTESLYSERIIHVHPAMEAQETTPSAETKTNDIVHSLDIGPIVRTTSLEFPQKKEKYTVHPDKIGTLTI